MQRILNLDNFSTSEISQTIEPIIAYQLEKGYDLDKHFFYAIYEEVRKQFNLENYVRSFYFSDKFKGAAGYSYLGSELCVNIERILREFATLKNIPKERLRLYSLIVATNLMIHELEHVMQVKRAFEEDTVEARLLRAEVQPMADYKRDHFYLTVYGVGFHSALESLMLDINKLAYYLAYHFNYKISIQERLAGIRANQVSLELATTFGDKKLARSASDYTYDLFTVGYNKTLTPTRTYLEKMNPGKIDWDEIEEETKDYSLADRLALGLEITKEERETLKTEQQLVLARIIK